MGDRIKNILDNYKSENPGIISKLYSILSHGRTGGSGKVVILPVDQGFEHGADRSFGKNPEAYDPDYHYNLAIKCGLSAYAAPIGFLSDGAQEFAGRIPTILKLNNSDSLSGGEPDQALTSSVGDALRLGCSAVGFTIYPGSGKYKDMVEEAREVIKEARSCGLPAVIWSYPRGGALTKEGETALDVISYGAHMAALLGAHIIKVKLPSDHIFSEEAKKIYSSEGIKTQNLEDRISRVVLNCFAGKRIVVFSGGPAKSEDEILSEVTSIKQGGGSGSIVGRNAFQRKFDEGSSLLRKICDIYKGN